MTKATLGQYLEIGQMIKRGELTHSQLQALIEGRYNTPLPSFSAHVTYVQPNFEELKRRFPDYVHPSMGYTQFTAIERCRGVSQPASPVEITFVYFRPDCNTSTNEALAEMDRRNLRPALYEELLSFAEKYPDEQLKYDIIALGSETFKDDCHRVARLGCSKDKRHLYLQLRNAVWDCRSRLLAVSKFSEQPQGGHPPQGGTQTDGPMFSAPVTYVQPGIEELRQRFPGYINSAKEHLRFTAVERCRHVSTESRVVTFEYIHLDRDTTSDEILSEMDRRGLRPALYEELLGFDAMYPDEQGRYPIVALGSKTAVFHDQRVASLWSDCCGRGHNERGLNRNQVCDGVWGREFRFLAVPKSSEQPLGGQSPQGGTQTDGVSFQAPIIYVQPRFEELKASFPNFVNPDFRGKKFEPIERCVDVATECRIVTFEYVHMDRDTTSPEVLDEMDRRGLRPALYEELLCFDEAFPAEQSEHPIVALGSTTDVVGVQCVACLFSNDRGRGLNLNRDCSDGWGRDYRFLAVRESDGA